MSGLTLGAGNFFGFGPSIQLPLFTGGRIRSNIAVQDARLEQAVMGYEREVLAAVEETENALAAYRREHERHGSLMAAVSASRQAVELARELYLAGPGDFLSVLEAQRALYANEEPARRERHGAGRESCRSLQSARRRLGSICAGRTPLTALRVFES